MERKRIYSGSGGEQRVGYCRAIVLPDPNGDWIFVSGTTGFDYAQGTISEDPAEQTEQTIRNIEKALKEAGASFKDVYYYRAWVKDAEVWEAAIPVLAKWFGQIKPATIAAIAPAMDEKIKIELEVEARLPPRE
jgi:enamine deaminase RidA (YjgF/YER057c/UK114 family)